MLIEKPETLRVRCCRCYAAFECKCEIDAIRGGVSDGSLYRGWRYGKLSLTSARLRVAPGIIIHIVIHIIRFLFDGFPARLCILPINHFWYLLLCFTAVLLCLFVFPFFFLSFLPFFSCSFFLCSDISLSSRPRTGLATTLVWLRPDRLITKFDLNVDEG